MAILGTSGNDLLNGTNVGDFIYGGSTVFNGDGNDTLNGKGGNDWLYGGEGIDTLDGGHGVDRLYGGGGDDIGVIVLSDAGDDIVVDGGSGIDTLVVYADGSENQFIFGSSSIAGTTGIANWEILNWHGSASSETIYGGALGDLIYGANGSDEIKSRGGNDLIYGGDGIDQLDGGTGDDIVHGDAGGDYIAASAGFDQLFGGSDNDYVVFEMLFAPDTISIDGGDGIDILSVAATSADTEFALGDATIGSGTQLSGFERLVWFGSDSDEIVTGGADNDVIYGNDGQDELTPGAGPDQVYGGLGDDYIEIDLADAGDDTAVEGGDGVDRLVIRADGSDVAFQLVDSSVAGTTGISGFEQLSWIGSDAGETVVGGNSTDFLYGGGASDILVRVGGNDWIDGGAGDDNIQIGLDGHLSATTAIGGAGIDALSIEGDQFNNVTFSFVVGGIGTYGSLTYREMETLTYTGFASNDTVTGGTGNDVFFGNAGLDRFYGGNGADTAYGGSDSDTLAGDAGNDTLRGGDGDDFIDGGLGNDTIHGDAGKDVIFGSGGSDTLYGGNDADGFAYYFIAAAGNGYDTVNGGGGVDAIFVAGNGPFGNNNNTIIGLESFSSIESINGGIFAGVTVAGSNNANSFDLTGVTVVNIAAFNLNGGNDVFVGSAAADVINGGGQSDTINGAGGADVITGGNHADMLTGGANVDTFNYDVLGESRRAVSADVITDFAAAFDRIDLAGIDANAFIIGDQAFNFIGTAAFTGVAGQLRADTVAIAGQTQIYGDINGDMVGDLHIILANGAVPFASDFLL